MISNIIIFFISIPYLIITNLVSHEGKQHVVSCTNLFRIDQQVIHDLQSLQANNVTSLVESESESLRSRTLLTFPQ